MWGRGPALYKHNYLKKYNKNNTLAFTFYFHLFKKEQAFTFDDIQYLLNYANTVL
jgi:hypothetical protein